MIDRLEWRVAIIGYDPIRWVRYLDEYARPSAKPISRRARSRRPIRLSGAASTMARTQSAVSGAFRFGAIPIVLRIPRIVAFSISDWVGG